jgi:hypothetical protein
MGSILVVGMTIFSYAQAPSTASFASWYDNFTSLAEQSKQYLSGFQEYFVALYKAYYTFNNPYGGQTAQVLVDMNISKAEQQFLTQREQATAQASINNLFALAKKKPAKKIRIAFSGTGGGYRAMILTSGYLAALEEMGLLNAFSYIAALSGSTWFLAPWIMSKESVRAYQQRLLGKIKNDTFNLLSPLITEANYKSLGMNLYGFIDGALWPKFLFNQPIGFIDFYGALLAQMLFSEEGILKSQQQRLAQQGNFIAAGEKPFPIYTAVGMHRTPQGEPYYDWYEFNPFEVRSIDHGLSIPSYAFGSKFSGGKANEIEPEQSLGFLLGIFGSAIAINADDAMRIIMYRTQEEQKSMTLAQKDEYEVAQKIIARVQANTPQYLIRGRVFAAQVNNPFWGMTNIPELLKKKEDLILVDGGIAYNIPLRPLMRPERAIDAIIIGESGSDLEPFREGEKMLADIQKVYNYAYQRVDDQKNPTLRFYKDPKNPRAPRIVYVALMNDRDLIKQAAPELAALAKSISLQDFDLASCFEKWCGTFNFSYSIDNFKQLSGLAEFNMRANMPAIAQWLAQEFGT